jgi:hypothetical protein
VPVPLQVEGAVSIAVAVSQEAGMQVVPAACRAHAPLPSQVPSVPQVEVAMARQVASGSLPPAETGWQLPGIPATAQDEQAGQPALPQQTCSTQWLLAHWVPLVQLPPFGVRFVQTPSAQEKPGTQSPSLEQATRHMAPAPHL